MDYIFLLTLVLFGSLLSLVGGFILLSNRDLAKKISKLSAPFAAGALIATALFDLLPESIELNTKDAHMVGIWMLVGVTAFFLLERQLSWFHHHHEHSSEGKLSKRRLPLMLVVGDTVHNGIDGAVIAIAFLADPSIGIITAFAVALHEIPQEIGDFGLLLNAGWSRKKVLIANALSASFAIVTATIVYIIGIPTEGLLPVALAITAGVLLYVACSDVIPQIHEIKSKNIYKDFVSILFLLGIIIVVVAVLVADSLAN